MTIWSILNQQRVLIVGSGPSAAQLAEIPEDIVLLCSNASSLVLLNRELGKPIDLLSCDYQIYFRYRHHMKQIFPKQKVKVFATNYPHALMNLDEVRYNCLRVVRGLPYHWFYDGFFAPLKREDLVNEIPSVNTSLIPSNGMRLLLYSLACSAKEIYLSGIDFWEGGWFKGHIHQHKKEDNFHYEIDHGIARHLSAKSKNIFSACEASAASYYFPYRSLL